MAGAIQGVYLAGFIDGLYYSAVSNYKEELDTLNEIRAELQKDYTEMFGVKAHYPKES